MATVVVSLDVLSARPDLTNTPEMYFVAGTNFTNDGYAFTSGGSKALYFKLGADLYGTGNITLGLQWMSRSGSTTGNVQWVAALAAITPGDPQSIETKAFATSQNATTTVNSTAKGDTLTSISIVNLDSVSAGDVVWIKLTRGTDTMVGDAVLIKPTVSYSDGNSGSPGSGDVVGPASATTTAIAVFNGTTGKLIQNSAVSLDSSGNFTGVGNVNAAVSGDSLKFNGSNVVPKLDVPLALTTQFSLTSTTLVTVTGLSYSIPRGGTYVFYFTMQVTQSANTVVGYAVSFTGTVTSIAYQIVHPRSATTFTYGTRRTTQVVDTDTRTTLGLTLPVVVQGTLVCTTSGAFAIQAQRAATNTVTIEIGSGGYVKEV